MAAIASSSPSELLKINTPTNPDINWQAIADAMSTVIGDRYVVRTREELLAYECDGLTSYKQQPALVALPSSTSEVAEIIKICDRYQIPFVARGSGTGLSGGALPLANSVLIVTSRMNRILEVDLENHRVTVQPGVINNWVTQAVSGAGFYYAPDPSSQIICSIGGNVAENSGGVHCLKYGVTTNHVLGAKIVLPDGSIQDIGGKIPETPGYDLTGLFVGSEGTLGIATEVTLKILKSAEAIQVLLADFTNVEAAGSTVSEIIRAGIIPGGMEIMDNMSINAVEDTVATNCYPRDAAAILLIEIDGLDSEVQENAKRVEAICYANGARNVAIACEPDQRLRLWKGRKAAFAAMGRLSPDYYVQDGVIPRTKLTFVLQEIAKLSEKYGYHVANVFHAGDGNLHPLILYNNAEAGALETVEELGGEILKLCVQVGGSISGEHGIGADKKCYMPEMFSKQDLETMQWVREVFDPQAIANPTKILPTPRTCGESAKSNLVAKYKVEYQAKYSNNASGLPEVELF
ncbi:MAG: glycolate oxidase subunit GlcD [Pseudanabaenaceae cyanobacterium bins.39]|nr:glycolate oxidase subunit GlcD [Pseudanabaenaceae cyanobacterium bins.39]